MRKPVLNIESINLTCLIYDSSSGEIVHIHEFLALPGVTPPTEAEFEAEAFDLACRIAGKERSEIAALHIRREALEIDVQYVVDLEKKTIVAQNSATKKAD